MVRGWLLLLLFGQLVDSEDFPKAMQERALAATVRIANRTRRVEGSGVFIGRKDKSTFILSASHLFGRGDRLEISTFTMATYPDPEKVYKKAEVVALTKGMKDIALIRLEEDVAASRCLALCPPEQLPKDKEFSALSVGCGLALAPICFVEKVKNARLIRRNVRMKPARFWETDDEQSAGRSGGPLIDRRGRVIGVASGTNEGKGYYNHADEIHRWLKSTDFAFLAAGKESPNLERQSTKPPAR